MSAGTTGAAVAANGGAVVPPSSVRCGVCCGTIRDPVSLSCGHANLCRAPCAKLLVERAASLAKLVALTSDPGATPPTYLMKGKTVFEEGKGVGIKAVDSAASGTNCVFIECPVCGEKTGVPVDKGVNALQTDMETRTKVELYLEQQKTSSVCDICEKRPSEYRCTCGVLVCKSPKCAAATKKMHAKGADHPLALTLLSEQQTAPIQRCLEHGKPFEFLCTKDRVPVCYMCLRNPAHQDQQSGAPHPSVLLTKATEEMRQTVLTQAAKIDGKATEIKSSISQIGTTRGNLEKTCTALRKEMNEKFDEVAKLIERRRQVLLDETEQIEQSTDDLLAAQQDFFEKQCLLLNASSSAAKLLANSIDSLQLCTSFDNTAVKLDSALQFKALLDPCCSPEVYFSSNLQCPGEVNQFGTISFGVDLTKSKLLAAIQPKVPLVGLPAEVTVAVSHLADLCGSPVPGLLIVPSLERLNFTICCNQLSSDPIQVKWKSTPTGNTGEVIPPEAVIHWVPHKSGHHSINIGAVIISSVNVQDIDLSKTVTSGVPTCCNVGTLTTIIIEPKFVTGEKISEDQIKVLPDLILLRYAVVPHDARVTDDQWTESQSATSISFRATQPGPHLLYVEGKYKRPGLRNLDQHQRDQWIPIGDSPVKLLATQVDVSKCTFKDFPGYVALNSTLKLQLQLFDQEGKPVEKSQLGPGMLQLKTTVGPALGKSAQGQVTASVENTEHIVTLSSQNVIGWSSISVEGTLDHGATFAHIAGSPFSLFIGGVACERFAWDGRQGPRWTVTDSGYTVETPKGQGRTVITSSQEIKVPTYFEVKVERRDCCGHIGVTDVRSAERSDIRKDPQSLTHCLANGSMRKGSTVFKNDGLGTPPVPCTFGVYIVPGATDGRIRFFLNKQPCGGLDNTRTTGMVVGLDMDGGRASSVPNPDLL
ncbi:hypothetical protein Pelo_15572 [Pelomyxa schiedti]|nr:hypothetical protein Pelo_15572 [Pelomyxa schiedti]